MRNQIVIVGGGMMGCGISAAALAAGESVTVVEHNPMQADSIRRRVQTLLMELQENDLADKQMSVDSLTVTADIKEATASAEIVIEAIVEDLEAKQQLFQKLDALLPPEVLIASNTSGLRITDIGKLSVHRERMATTHFWFPGHLVPLVEIVMSEDTLPETAQHLKTRLASWGKAPVIVKKDLPGQLANRILQAVIREASHIVEIGLASPEDVDTAVKMGMGIRFPVWGPLEHVDGVGVDLCERVQDTVLPGISDEKAANDAFRNLVAQNHLGYKTGKGFYDWSQKDMRALETLRNEFIMHSVKFLRSHSKENNYETV